MELASDVIDLFLEYRDVHGCDEETAKARTIVECGEAMQTAARDTDIFWRDRVIDEVRQCAERLANSGMADRCKAGNEILALLPVQST